MAGKDIMQACHIVALFVAPSQYLFIYVILLFIYLFIIFILLFIYLLIYVILLFIYLFIFVILLPI